MKNKNTETGLNYLSKKIVIRYITAILIISDLIFIFGCPAKNPIIYHELTLKVVRDNYPKSMAVLPFINKSAEEKIDELVRISFYSHFSARPYIDIELHQIDKKITNHKGIDADMPSKADLKKWGQMLGCDAIIIGEVNQFKRIYLGVYSQIKLAAYISIWDTKTGQKIYDDQHVVRSHEGGVPFHLAEVPLIAIKSGLHLLEKEKVRAVDELCRYLTGRIPAPVEMTMEQKPAPIYTYELQVGAFIDGERADSLLGLLREKGYPAFIRKKEKNSGTWNRVILGPYEKMQEAVNIRNKIKGELNIHSFIVQKKTDTAME